jgi:outer membrane protein OmpA-like peptidoglycan-associated protein
MKFRYLTFTILSVALAASPTFAKTGSETPLQKTMAPFVKKSQPKQSITTPLPSPVPASGTRRTSISGRNYFGAEIGLTSGVFDGGPVGFTGENQYIPGAELSTVSIEKHSPAFGLSIGGVVDFALSESFGLQGKIGYRSVSSTGERDYEMDCADPQGVTGIASMHDEYASTVGYLGIDALARIQFAADGLYGLAGLGFSNVLSANAEISKTIVSSPNDCQWLDADGFQTGELVNKSDVDFKEDLNSSRFDLRLGVGTWIPVGDNGMVIVPELTIGYPLTEMLDQDGVDAYKLADLSTPNLIYANLTVGIKFPWGGNSSSSSPTVYDNSSSSSSTNDQSTTPEAGKAMLSGRVVDNNGQPIDDAQVTVVDLNNNQVVATDETDNGMYNVKVNTPGRYSVTADAPGYLFGSALFEVDKDGRILKSSGDIKLSPSTDGRVRLLVFFDFDKATLQSSSYPELNRAVALMKSNPNMQVEIAGFTDAQGTDSYNKDLSQRRANSVREYLVRQGIEGARLTAMGYGEANPVATNDTEDGRAENRRVEFVVKKR